MGSSAFAEGEKALVAAGADMPKNSFTESTNEMDAALVPDTNVAADASNINTTEIRPIRRNFDLPNAEEWDDGVSELSDLMDIVNSPILLWTLTGAIHRTANVKANKYLN